MPPAGQSNEPDNSMAPIWITIGVFLAFGMIWYFFQEEIIHVILWIRYYEAKFLLVFIPSGWSQPLKAVEAFYKMSSQSGFSGISFEQLLHVSTAVGDYLRYPVALTLGGLAVLLFSKNPISKYKRTHSMQSLLDNEKYNWPQIIPVASLDLINTPLNDGPWAMALQPMGFAKERGLIIFDKVASQNMKQPTATINRDEARRIFALQLGRFWTSPENLPIYARVLFATFAARVNGDRDGAAKLLEQISKSSASGKLDFSGADDLLRKHKNNKHILRLTQRHAFEITVLASLLEFARTDGVFASADFLWLKPTDRRLWFMLNTVGRQTPFCEVAGVFAHWISEKQFGRKLNVPMVEEAVTGLEVAIKEIVYHPDDDDDE